MKIAILTHPLGRNYGGIMQAYALQKVIRDCGHEVKTIDRQSDRRSIIERALLKIKPLIYKLLGKNTYRRLTPKEQAHVFPGMTGFLDEYIVRTEPLDTTAKLIAHFQRERYDMVVVGSDQVWRPSYSPSIFNYFLDFKSAVDSDFKAIAYAASFGVDNWEFDSQQTKKARELIGRFEGVSVRENGAVKLCQEKLGINAEIVLDPTLLLEHSVYTDICGATGSSGGKGIFTYILDQSESKSAVIREIAEEFSLPVFSCQPARPLSDGRGKSLNEYRYPPVKQWLNSFIDADYIITDSFHGCVFAIIFKKPFLAIGNRARGLSRFTSLLGRLQLDDRLILTDQVDAVAKMRENIDWDSVRKLLSGERDKSFNYLKNWL